MKIAILGYGKMGRTIERLAHLQGDEVVLKIDSHNKAMLTKTALQKADVAIEFSEPSSAFENIRFCLENGVPVVSGTTAWLDKFEAAKQICEANKGAFLYASNFSIGVNIFFQLNQTLAKMMAHLDTYRVSMEEIHHTEKKDAPSGTAITLAEAILAQNPTKTQWVNKKSDSVDDLSIISKRLPDVPGTHAIHYQSAVDSIEIVHTAHSREGFASGAILAARWLIGKQGCFGMEDVLNL